MIMRKKNALLNMHYFKLLVTTALIITLFVTFTANSKAAPLPTISSEDLTSPSSGITLTFFEEEDCDNEITEQLEVNFVYIKFSAAIPTGQEVKQIHALCADGTTTIPCTEITGHDASYYFEMPNQNVTVQFEIGDIIPPTGDANSATLLMIPVLLVLITSFILFRRLRVQHS